MADSPNDYTFNGTDYECIIRLTNGSNDIYLAPDAWNDLIIEEDIFQWFIKGSIVIKSGYDNLERSSAESRQVTGKQDKDLIYKFRNDGRDTLYISIFPKATAPYGLSVGDFSEKLWRIEIEAVVYDVEDFTHSNITNKMKKLYFWEKTYQLMLEKNIEYSTATVGDNKGKEVYKLSNADRSLKTGDALGQLLLTDDEFSINAKNVGGDLWNVGDDKNKIFYTSLSNNTFNDDLNYLLYVHGSSESDKFQPCIFKFERAEKKLQPKQFSLMSIKDYFAKAGVSSPGTYQIEHVFLEENSENSTQNPVNIIKAPISSSISTSVDVKAEDFSNVSNYQIVDFSGLDYSQKLHNRFISSFNGQQGQFNIEIVEHKSEKYQDFYKDNIKDQVLNQQPTERIPLTNYITKGYNSEYIYSQYPLEQNRIADGRNKLLKYYLFDNLGICFSVRGLTIRQPGRFFGLSKKTQNIEEFDHKLEGQYFVTNIIHYFSNEMRGYYTQITGVKTHTFKEENPIQPDDVKIIQG